MADHKGKREKYLERAREAEQKAAETKDYSAREIWQNVARNYHELARLHDEGY